MRLRLAGLLALVVMLGAPSVRAAISLQVATSTAAGGTKAFVSVFASSNATDAISGFNFPLDIGATGAGFPSSISLDATPIQNSVFNQAALNISFNSFLSIDGIANSDGSNLTLPATPTKLFDLVLDVASGAAPSTIPIRIVSPTSPVNQFNLSGPSSPSVSGITAGSITIQAVDADFNDDHIVDGADFLLWQRTLGTSNPAVDASGNGVVDALDLAAWRSAFGTTPAVARFAGVPEPSAAVLAAFALGSILMVRRTL